MRGRRLDGRQDLGTVRMSKQKVATRTATAAFETADRPEKIRNVALVGHSGGRQDHAGRGAARRDRHDRAGRQRRRRQHGQRQRPGRGRAAALGRAVGVPAALGSRGDQPARHPGLPRLHRRAARRAARRRRRAVRRLGRRRHRPDHRLAVGGVRGPAAPRGPSSSPSSTRRGPTTTPPSRACQRVFGGADGQDALPLYVRAGDTRAGRAADAGPLRLRRRLPAHRVARRPTTTSTPRAAR